MQSNRGILTLIVCNILAMSLAKSYVPEHCANYEGAMFEACVKSAISAAAGTYTNTKLSYPVFDNAGVTYYDATQDRDATPSYEHSEFYELDESSFSAKPVLAEV
nr:orf3a protein [Betacoronavirus Erinaceus]QRN68092.1 orf3a protein [Betacoronavirus Erinaceus]QRN68113.1 orf3a protein [Betacoronavirus Erinaceus]